MPDRPFPPAPPAFGEPLPPARPSQEVMDFFALRRSTPVVGLSEPGPAPGEVDALLRVAARVPDHGKLAPWRFLVFEGRARAEAGVILEAAARKSQLHLPEEGFALEAQRFLRAPVVVAVISQLVDTPKIPEWEQRLSSAAVCMQLVHAASAMGYAAQWLTEWYAYDADVAAGFGLAPTEKVAGFVYIGTARAPSPERVRPEMAERIRRWSP